MKRSISIFVIIFYSLLMAKEKAPSWISKPPAGTFIGVSQVLKSEQDARTDAIKDAKKQIIATLGGMIETEFVDQIIEENASTASFTDSKVKIVAKNIIAVKPSDIYVEEIEEKSGFKKTTLYKAYAAIPFSREKHDQFMLELVAETEKLARQRLTEIEQQALEGQVLFAIDELRKLPTEYKNVLEITSLTPQQLSLMKTLDQDVNFLNYDIRNNLRMESSGLKYLTKLNHGLNETLEINVFWQKNNHKIPVQGLDLKYNYPDKSLNLTTLSKTNKNGQVFLNINKILTTKQINLEVVANFPDSIDIQPLSLTFYLIPDNKIAVKISESILEEQVLDSYFENSLMQQLSESDFQIIDNNFMNSINGKNVEFSNEGTFARLAPEQAVDFIILGNITIDRTNKFNEGMFFAWSKAVVKVYDVQKNEIIASMVHSEKGAGNSIKDASIKAIQKAGDLLSQQIVAKIENTEVQ
ncbi:MAG: hypothetical protein JXQ65_06425 [Candidatus Marinimicrobia bacterium]|nr:hypothetical protein [Candidatus Neomarinimicrobiota bacterium]